MKKILIRHGFHDPGTGYLTKQGEEQMRQLAARLTPHVTNEKSLLFSSIAPRAIASAHVLSDELKVPFEATRNLGESDGSLRKIERLLTLFSEHQDDAEVIMAVTHEPVILEFLFAYHRSDPSFIFRGVSYRQGDGLLIDSSSTLKAVEVI